MSARLRKLIVAGTLLVVCGFPGITRAERC
jgi:hypothetical protein